MVKRHSGEAAQSIDLEKCHIDPSRANTHTHSHTHTHTHTHSHTHTHTHPHSETDISFLSAEHSLFKQAVFDCFVRVRSCVPTVVYNYTQACVLVSVC